METLYAYLLKMIICSAVLLAYYWLALRNERFHLWNRFYLVAAILLSLLVPLLHLPIKVETDPTAMETMIGALPWNRITNRPNAWWTRENIIAIAASLVSLVLLLRLILSVRKIFRLYEKHDHTFINEVSVIVTKEESAPFSFFKWLFWRSDIDPNGENGKRMLEHELVHIREQHSADKLLTELVLIVFWMNPFFWIIRRELYAIHEFLADRKAIAGQDGAAFAAMILQAAHSGCTPSLSNPFFNSQLKRRLIMITTSHAPKYSYIRRVSGLTLMALITMVLVLSIEHSVAQKSPPPRPVHEVPPPPPPSPLPDSILSVSVTQNNGSGSVVYSMKDGRRIMMKLKDAENLGYPLPPPPPPVPAVAPIEPVSPILPIAPAPAVPPVPAIPIVPAAPVAPVVPVVPAAPPSKVKIASAREWEDAATGAEDPNKIRVTNREMYLLQNTETGPAHSPLIVYDGMEISSDRMNLINPKNIYSVNVLKGETAMKAYGEKGKNGVVQITPKKVGDSQNVVEDNARTITNETAVTSAGLVAPQKALPIYYIDGKKSSAAVMQQLDPKLIEKVNVLKGDAAIKVYGEKGADGVVEITTLKPRAEK